MGEGRRPNSGCPPMLLGRKCQGCRQLTHCRRGNHPIYRGASRGPKRRACSVGLCYAVVEGADLRSMASNGPRGGHTCCLETAQDEVSLRAAEAVLAGSLEGLCTCAPPAHQLLLSCTGHGATRLVPRRRTGRESASLGMTDTLSGWGASLRLRSPSPRCPLLSSPTCGRSRASPFGRSACTGPGTEGSLCLPKLLRALETCAERAQPRALWSVKL